MTTRRQARQRLLRTTAATAAATVTTTMTMRMSLLPSRRIVLGLSHSLRNSNVRPFSFQPQAPPPQRPNRFQKGSYAEHIPLRTNAINLYHDNYDDEDDDGDAYGMEEPFGTDDHDKAKADPDVDGRKSRMASILLQEEEERAKQKARWLEVAQPVVRKSEIDDRGRAFGRGGRKTSTARVWIQPGTGEVVVNRLTMEEYFSLPGNRAHILEPFVVTKTCGKFDVMAWVEGGGTTGQSGAIRHGIARALNHFNPDLYRPPLKLFGLMTRDPRSVERKKIGLRKARKAPQWVKR